MTEEYVIMKCDKWRKFYTPFKCFCCGKIISSQQFCFSALCPYCDVGKCRKNMKGITNILEERHGRKDIMMEGEIVIKLEILEKLK